MSNKFVKSSIIYFLGNIFLKGINFFTLPIFTRLMLPSDYGMYSLYSASLGILMILVGLQIQGTVSLAYTNRTQEQFDSYVSNITLFPFIGVFLSIILVILVPFSSDILSVPSKAYGIIMIFQSFFNIIIMIYQAELTIKQKPKQHFILSIVTALVSTALSIGFILMLKDNTYFARVISGALGNLIIMIYIYLHLWKRIDFKTLKNDWHYGLQLSLPLVFHNLSGQILNVADRFMLVHYTSEEDVALYSFAYNLGMILQMIWLSVNNAWVPWYFDNLKRKKFNIIQEYCKEYIYFFTLITILLILIVPELVIIMGGKQYIDAIYITPLILLGYYFVFLYSFYVNFQFYRENTKLIPIATIIAAVFNIIFNIIIIPKHGVLGAAMSTAISYFIMLLLHCIVTLYILKHRDFPERYVFISSLFISILVSISYYIMNSIIIRLILAVSAIMIYGVHIFVILIKKGEI